MAVQTHCERVLERLRRGPASHLELYALGTVAHSRISDLRKKGHEIEQWRDGDLYMYRLVSLSETPATIPPKAVGGTGVSLSVQGPLVSPPDPRDETCTCMANGAGTGAQLSFEAAA